jgi:citrate lyase gamma subunit
MEGHFHDKTRSMELVTALVDSQCLTPGIQDHTDAYWLVLATQTMNQLVQYLENQHGGKRKQQVAAVLAHLCHSVATAMMVDKTKLEKLTSKQVRSVVGRAMVTLAVGALTAMPYTTGKPLWASVLALDMVTFQQTIKATPTVDGWHAAQLALTAYVEDETSPRLRRRQLPYCAFL